MQEQHSGAPECIVFTVCRDTAMDALRPVPQERHGLHSHGVVGTAINQ